MAKNNGHQNFTLTLGIIPKKQTNSFLVLPRRECCRNPFCTNVQVPKKDIGSIEWDAGSWRSTTLLTALGWRSYSVNYFALLFSILLCSALLLLYFALLCPILPCSTLLCSSEPLCQLPANHRLTCKKPPPIEFPGFFLWLAGSPYLASQCLHVRRTWPPVWIFFA